MENMVLIQIKILHIDFICNNAVNKPIYRLTMILNYYLAYYLIILII